MIKSVIHISKSLYGGGGVYAQRLSQALGNAGYDSRVMTLDGGLVPSVTGVLDKIYAGYDRVFTSLINRRTTAPFSSIQRLSRFKSLDKISGDDIIHLHSITQFIGSRGLRSLIPKAAKVFWTTHNPWMLTAGCVLYQGCDLYRSGCKDCPILKFPIKVISKTEYRKKTDFIRDYNIQPIANSEWMASMIKSSPLFSNLIDIPIIKPIVQSCFHYGEKNRKIQITSSDDKVVIGLGARSLTDNYKGIKEFFSNIPVDAPWIKKVRFLLFGEGTLSLPPNLDVMMLGSLRTPESMADAYRSMDVYVSPTAMETYGMTLVEAQACGTPVIAFNTGATPEAVCPEAGWLVSKGDFNGLYELLVTLCESREKLNLHGLKAAQWVLKQHASDVIAAEQVKIYQSLK